MIRRTARSSIFYIQTSFLAILVLVALYKLQIAFPFRLPTFSIHQKIHDGCHSYPSANNVVISVKTGATEASSKIPTIMQTSLRCAQNIHIFSDLEQDIGPYHLHDALSSISPAVKAHPDSDLYHHQQASLHNLSALREIKHSTEWGDKLASRILDKYKFLHVVEKTWMLQAEKDWYVFIEADTYLIYSNLLLWLSTLDPNEKLYLGSEIIINEGIPFAHGGTGFVLSQALVRDLVRKESAKKWESKMEPWCCGDIVLAIAIQEDTGTRLTQAWPLTQGERAIEVPFGGAMPEFWCGMVGTFHHMGPVEMGELGEFERWWEGSSGEPLTYASLFQNFVKPLISNIKEDWDNFAAIPGLDGRTGGGNTDTETVGECAGKCEQEESCFQYAHHGRTCHLSKSVRMGERRGNSDGRGTWRSGWHVARMERWMEGMSCNGSVRAK